MRRADERLAGTWEPIARILLRTEDVASSNIAGLRAPIEAVAVADPSAARIADNLVVVTEAIRTPRRRRSSIAMLHPWYTRLMRHSDLPTSIVGMFRDAQGWIGRASPVDAVHVPPPAREVTRLMRDLVTFANRSDIDPITHAAVLHAQFETIHP